MRTHVTTLFAALSCAAVGLLASGSWTRRRPVGFAPRFPWRAPGWSRSATRTTSSTSASGRSRGWSWPRRWRSPWPVAAPVPPRPERAAAGSWLGSRHGHADGWGDRRGPADRLAQAGAGAARPLPGRRLRHRRTVRHRRGRGGRRARTPPERVDRQGVRRPQAGHRRRHLPRRRRHRVRRPVADPAGRRPRPTDLRDRRRARGSPPTRPRSASSSSASTRRTPRRSPRCGPPC